ncbi:RTA1 like protein [Colletotrichum plurivorum]|uniref:RTA1 like protein n=1 Tax=Colletotrichum plurivorum TaxID=2175906 RepID=A0A8H6NKA5_9PEZI|nr:RTA1 like protein [Colletotrichum plurivorum]
MYTYDETLYDEGWTSTIPRYCSQNPSDHPQCRDVPSYYPYTPDWRANAVFTAVYAGLLLCFAAIWIFNRSGHAFNLSLLLGTACELAGYACRWASSHNPWRRATFLVQLCSLIMGPTFYAAAIYLCLRRVIVVFGAEHSRIPPKWFPRIFVPCDLVSLVLQAVGGGLAAVASHKGHLHVAADRVMVAGLGFQVLTMLCFVLVAGDFALRVWRGERRAARQGSAAMLAPVVLGREAAALQRLRGDAKFRWFLAALAVATHCIFLRCVYRIAELGGGWESPPAAREDLFVVFEGAAVTVAALGLFYEHSAFCREKFLGVERDDPRKAGGYPSIETIRV